MFFEYLWRLLTLENLCETSLIADDACRVVKRYVHRTSSRPPNLIGAHFGV